MVKAAQRIYWGLFMRKSACRLLLAATAFFLSLSLPSFADATIPTEDIAGSADNALAKRYEGSFIVSYDKQAFTDFRVPLSPLKRSEDTEARDSSNNTVHRPERKIDVEGALTRLVYIAPQGRSPLEVLRNYQDVVEEAGGAVEFECKTEECGGDAGRAAYGGGGKMSLTQNFFYDTDIKDKELSTGACAVTSRITNQRYFSARVPQDAGDAWVTVQTYSVVPGNYCTALKDRTVAIVHVVEPKPRDKKMVLVEAAEMANAIDLDGSIALYGIFFDTDKTDLKPESQPTLKEIATLLSANPQLAVLVVGHTDSQGKFDYNLDLSSRRAAAVKAALVSAHGTDANRIATAGAGMMAPVASNATEDGRAKNRRVVLVKAN